MSIRIEFCGVPGSGKSTLCAGAIHQLRRRGQKVLDRASMADEQLRRRDFGLLANTISAWVPGWRQAFLSFSHGMDDWLRFVVQHPEFAARIHVWLAEAGMSEFWRRAVFHAMLTTAFEFELSMKGESPVLLDEGFAQRFFSLRGYGVKTQADDANLYAEWMPMPSALILMTTSPEICLSRIQRRAQRPLLMRNEPESTLPDRFSEGMKLLDGLGTVLERRGLPVLRIEGDGNIEDGSSKIADFVEMACEIRA